MDREKVKKGLEIILNGCDEIQCEDCCFHIKEPTKPRRCGMIEEQIQEEALALLKKQEEQKFFVDESGKITPLPVVVRCKDCKHMYFADNRIPSEQGYVCGRNGIDVTMDRYCADGERQEVK